MRFSGIALSLLISLVGCDVVVGFSSSLHQKYLNSFKAAPTRETQTFALSRRQQQQQRHHTPPLTLSSVTVNGETSTATTNDDDDDDPSPSTPPGTNIRLTLSEKARTVTSVCTSGTLCTLSNAEDIRGAPFGSFVDYVLDDEGNPIFLMNEMSMHTININQNPSKQVTLFTQLSSAKAQTTGQDISRVSLTGSIEQLERTAENMDTIRMRYSIYHAYADQVMDSPKFHFYRLTPQKIYFVGGFGVTASWVPVRDYYDAEPDILAGEASDIVAKLNREHGEDLFLTALHLLEIQNIEDITITNVDRLGLDIRVTKQAGVAMRRKKFMTDEFRIGFRIPVMSVEDAKSEIVKIFQEAWEKGEGYVWDGEDDLPGSDVPIVKIAEDSLG